MQGVSVWLCLDWDSELGKRACFLLHPKENIVHVSQEAFSSVIYGLRLYLSPGVAL